MDSVVDNSNWLRVVASVAFTYLVVQLVRILYTAYFGPLSKIPGPKLNALTGVVNLLRLWRGEEARDRRRLHEHYGHAVRYGPTGVSFNTAAAWKDIYGHRVGGKPAPQKDPNFYGKEPLSGHRSIFDAGDEDHSRMRRILSHSFSDKALKEQEPVLRTWTDLLLRKLHEHVEKHPDEATDLVKRFSCATFDLMADLTFAESLGMLEGGEYSPWVKTIYESLKLGTRLRCFTSLPVIGDLIRKGLKAIPKVRQAQFEHISYSVERVRRRMQRTDLAHSDLWTEVIKRGEKYGLSMGEMESNSSIFMLAGTETTATLLSGLSFYLMKNPEAYSRLTTEIRGSFSDREEITLEKLRQLPYLNACLEEGLRVYPPVPIGMPRIVPPEGMTVDGVFLPGGTQVSVSQYATYSSRDNFFHPEEFHPERWLPGNEEFARDNKAALQPFSMGPRNCIGMNLAYHEMRLLLASVLHDFDIELDPRSANWHDIQTVYTVWEKIPLWTKLRPVKA